MAVVLSGATVQSNWRRKVGKQNRCFSTRIRSQELRFVVKATFLGVHHLRRPATPGEGLGTQKSRVQWRSCRKKKWLSTKPFKRKPKARTRKVWRTVGLRPPCQELLYNTIPHTRYTCAENSQAKSMTRLHLRLICQDRQENVSAGQP